jgi:hypothetical protein
VLFGTVLEGAPQEVNVLGQISLFDEGIRPHAVHQVVLRNNFATTLYQNQEDFNCFRRQRNQLGILG